jgi:anti-sigma factor RsiW
MGAVGGLLVRQLENEIASLRDELARLKSARPADPATPNAEGHKAADPPPPATPSSQLAPVPLAVVNATPLVKQPALWFAVAGWALALILIFRRRTI